MRLVKKTLTGIGILVTLFIATAIAVPILFEDDIKALVKKELTTSINADIDFNFDNLDLTLFSNFPRLTVSMKDFSISNRAPFQGNRLFSMKELGVDINLYDLVLGDQIKIDGITLVRPTIHVKILPNGMASYDIVVPGSDTVTKNTEEAAAFSFQIDHWQIIDGAFIYDDLSNATKLVAKGLNHKGSGSFNEKMFDLETHTMLDSLSALVGKTAYLSNKRIEADLTLGISEKYTRFTFKENKIKINDFELAFDGWFKMDGKNYDVDLRYNTRKNSFKTLLSLVPGIYTKQFKDIDAKGELTFSGFVKGIHNEQRIPAFQLHTEIHDGMFGYPELPKEIRNINLALLIDNKDGVVKNTRIDLQRLHLNFGSNPFDARILIENLRNYKMDGDIKTKVNLEDINKIFPVEGLSMKGSFSVQAKASGVYDSIKKTIPALDMVMALHDGYVKSDDFPLPLENITFDAFVKNVSGNMAETKAHIKNVAMLMDGEKFVADMAIENWDDYTWDINALGTVDLKKITNIFPLDNMTLSGTIKANVHTKGKMSDVTNKRYANINTRGEAFLSNFTFASKEVPYTIGIEENHVIFDPFRITLKNMKGNIGKNDLQVEGYLQNYMGYLFGKNETIRGGVNITSNRLNLNEFMTTEEEQDATVEEEEHSYGVISVPDHVYAEVRASAKSVEIMDYELTNTSAIVVVKNRAVQFKKTKFNLLGGKFQMTGKYDTKTPQHPGCALQLDVDNLAIDKTFNSFSIVKTYVPIAQFAKGKFNAHFSLTGKLLSDMTFDMPTVSGKGSVQTIDIGLRQSPIMDKIIALTKLSDASKVTLKNSSMQIAIDKGRMSVRPFDVQFGDYKTNVQGSIGMDGTMDYLLTINVPASKLGNQLQGYLQQYGGDALSEIPVMVRLGGTYNKPTFKLETREQKEELKKAMINVVKKEGEKLLKQAANSEEGKKLINDLLNLSGDKKPQDSTKKTEPVKQLLQKGLRSLFNKKKD